MAIAIPIAIATATTTWVQASAAMPTQRAAQVQRRCSPTSQETQPNKAPRKPQMDAARPSCLLTGQGAGAGGGVGVGKGRLRSLSAVFLIVSESTSEISF